MVRVRWPVLEFYTPCNISATANARDFEFCTRVGHVKSVSLVMSECSLSACGQGHTSNFYIVDLKNFATASRRYTVDIHNSSFVGLFMTPVGQWKWLDRVSVECTFITHCHTVTLQLHNFDLFRTCRISSFCTLAWQLARFQLTRRIARSLGYRWASCSFHRSHVFLSCAFSFNSSYIMPSVFRSQSRSIALGHAIHFFPWIRRSDTVWSKQTFHKQTSPAKINKVILTTTSCNNQ